MQDLWKFLFEHLTHQSLTRSILQRQSESNGSLEKISENGRLESRWHFCGTVEIYSSMHRLRSLLCNLRSLLGFVSPPAESKWSTPVDFLSGCVHKRGSSRRRRETNLFEVRNEKEVHKKFFYTEISKNFSFTYPFSRLFYIRELNYEWIIFP